MIENISAIAATSGTASLASLTSSLGPIPGTAAPSGSSAVRSFETLLTQGVSATEQKMAAADTLVTAFALNDDIPVHQVTFAMEQARLSFELMLQVRDRLLEGYQQLMNTQI